MDVKQILANRKVQLGLVAGVSALAGGAVGYIAAMKVLEPKYQAMANREIAESKAFYKAIYKPDLDDLAAKYEPNGKDQESSVKDAAAAMEQYRGEVEELEEETPEVIESNIFVESKPAIDGFDFEVEASKRSEDHPYIITQEEFLLAEKDYEQTTLTWFEGDDTLTDDKDQPIPDTDATVGDEALLRFGHGSKDNNIVYVRNDKMQMEFEVVRSDGSYTQEILGFQHSDRPGSRKPRRYRGDDE